MKDVLSFILSEFLNRTSGSLHAKAKEKLALTAQNNILGNKAINFKHNCKIWDLAKRGLSWAVVRSTLSLQKQNRQRTLPPISYTVYENIKSKF